MWLPSDSFRALDAGQGEEEGGGSEADEPAASSGGGAAAHGAESAAGQMQQLSLGGDGAPS
jgi:hypothetical protein